MQVQRRMCRTCIYRRDSPLSLQKLEDEVRDPVASDFFVSYRVCHHAPRASRICCAGFWKRYKNWFPLGQIAQRLGLVQFVKVDDMEEELVCAYCGKSVPRTRQRLERLRLLEELGRPQRAYCDPACNTSYWNQQGRSQKGHWSKYGGEREG